MAGNPLDNLYFDVFEKYYKQLVKALPMDSMYPTLFSKGLLRGGLAEKLEAEKTDIDKARVFLNSLSGGLRIGGTETFDLFLEAMAEYEMVAKKEEIRILLSRIRKDLLSSSNVQVEQLESQPGSSGPGM